MNDLFVIGLMLLFFVGCLGFVHGCDRVSIEGGTPMSDTTVTNQFTLEESLIQARKRVAGDNPVRAVYLITPNRPTLLEITTAADLALELLSRKVTRRGVEIPLQAREFKLLEHLMRHAGQVVTRTMLLESVWDYHFDPQTNVIDVHISRLRQKIDQDFATPLLHTVRGAGYRLGA